MIAEPDSSPTLDKPEPAVVLEEEVWPFTLMLKRVESTPGAMDLTCVITWPQVKGVELDDPCTAAYRAPSRAR